MMSIQTEYKHYSVNNKEFKGYLASNNSLSAARPGVLVFPEWWGLNSYIKKRTEQVAELGYLAFGVDMYGDGKKVDNPEEAGLLMNEVLADKQTIKTRLEGAYNFLKEHPMSDSNKIGAIGYCFGGALVLNMARMGMDLQAVTSFHGALDSFFSPSKGDVKAKVLVCHGEADEFISKEAVVQFKLEMNNAGADYEFISHQEAFHGFSNPAADELGLKFKIPLAYNESADRYSWKSMKELFENNF